jgi:hypothetical protein
MDEPNQFYTHFSRSDFREPELIDEIYLPVSTGWTVFSTQLYIYLEQHTPPWIGLANHVGQTYNTISTIRSNSSRLAPPAAWIAMRL